MSKLIENRKTDLKRFGVDILVDEIIKIEDEQYSYEASLRAEIERIQALKPWKRFWSSVELFRKLFEVIEEWFKNEE